MAVTMPSPQEQARLGDLLAGMIQTADNPDIKAALQARLSPQPTEQGQAPVTLDQAMQARQMPQPLAPEQAPVLRTMPPGWGDVTAGMSTFAPQAMPVAQPQMFAPGPTSPMTLDEIFAQRRLPQGQV